METFKKILKALLLFIVDISLTAIMYKGFWRTTLGEWILLVAIIVKEVMYVRTSKTIGIAGTFILFICGLLQLDYGKIIDSSMKALSVLGEILGGIVACAIVIYAMKQFSSGSTNQGYGRRSDMQRRSSNQYDQNPDSSLAEERTLERMDIPSGACPYIHRDGKGYLYCNISGGEREIDAYTYSAKCKWSDTFKNCRIYRSLSGHEDIIDDLRQDGENYYQSTSSRYACPYIFQDRGGYRYCTAGGRKELIDSWQYSHSCGHSGDGNSGYTGCQIYLVNK